MKIKSSEGRGSRCAMQVIFHLKNGMLHLCYPMSSNLTQTWDILKKLLLGTQKAKNELAYFQWFANKDWHFQEPRT